MPDDGYIPHARFVSPNEIRRDFCAALSSMYRLEVPLYGELIDLVNDVNERVKERGGSWETSARLGVERHGAIRLGRPSELAFIARFFATLGMYPVGYYDLSTSGVPVHATAFRPISSSALEANPFRVFTSLLRPELISDPMLRQQALDILAKREIFHPRVRELVTMAERQGGLGEDEAKDLVQFGLETFRWHETAFVDQATYRKLDQAHPLVADIVGFRGPHINHLTPRVLDIDTAQRDMIRREIPAKQIIEGPPARQCPILLRQTSFQALTEAIRFPGGEGLGAHRARFGEIESRGVALTPKGHDLYMKLMDELKRVEAHIENNDEHQANLQKVFARFPDSWKSLRKDRLAYFTYSLAFTSIGPGTPRSLEDLIDDGIVTVTPIVYEDFLPASAAGIFQSNLGSSSGSRSPTPEESSSSTESSKVVFEEALGQTTIDYFELYEQIQQKSLDTVRRLTGGVVP
ncbi:hypothetical protein BD324DRAFT_627981 [Kockovaella imperatae]|uniref:2-oxoadipate dioxygenase/decarboxylase n=1 Tax=Kockovaella imperatae TaxID=4999 RepID=A0A1Y1UDV6_9TREE|nr:hypothetical protein BD324DRAFT_627981 [Kockovaella imperatae]ORX36230.1 hypothetical protein BD324DRAFT_627981 [Kockovaella imperatae]